MFNKLLNKIFGFQKKKRYEVDKSELNKVNGPGFQTAAAAYQPG